MGTQMQCYVPSNKSRAFWNSSFYVSTFFLYKPQKYTRDGDSLYRKGVPLQEIKGIRSGFGIKFIYKPWSLTERQIGKIGCTGEVLRDK